MRRRTFLRAGSRAALGCCLLPLTARAQGKKGAAKSGASALIDGLEEAVPRLMEEFKVPGASIAIVKDGKLHWQRGLGVKDRESRKPVDEDTVFEVASVSKTVFAYTALNLCEKGVIGLDAPLTKYTAKPFLEGDARLKLITARRVLSHSTGLPSWRSGKEPLKIQFTPGERYSYSGEGYFYLQSVVTRLKGRTDPGECSNYEAGLEVCATDIDAFMKANLLVPFGMASSGYVWNEHLEKHSARPHDSEGRPTKKSRPKAADAARYAAAGGLHTTPGDYAKFLIEVIDPRKSDAFRLKRDSLREMVRPHVKVDDSSSWALGWQVRHGKQGDIIQHGGNNTGFHAFAFASVERKSGLIMMTNGDSGWKIYANPAFGQMVTRFLTG